LENSGLLCIAGGKYTTYRNMAKQLVDRAVKLLHAEYPELGRNLRPCFTHKEPIVFPFTVREREFYRRSVQEYTSVLGEVEVAHLQAQYGPRWQCVADLAMERTELRQRIIPDEPNIIAEIVYAKEQELAVNYDDYLRRRSQLALRTNLAPHLDALRKVEHYLSGGSPQLSMEQLHKWQGKIK
jgi:glycerol-3-phosphate dehydrogenase